MTQQFLYSAACNCAEATTTRESEFGNNFTVLIPERKLL